MFYETFFLINFAVQFIQSCVYMIIKSENITTNDIPQINWGYLEHWKSTASTYCF